jgi:RHS repeat-associated protein
LATDRRADALGKALDFTPSSAITDYLYDQQYYDSISGQYYIRARNYDPATGTFTQQDSYTINPGDLANANLYLFAGADAVNMFDPTGMFSMTLGTAVHQYLSRKEFELNGSGGAIAQYYKRFGNRYVSTILNYIDKGTPAFSLPFRPDMVGIYGPLDARIGDVYELKAGPITLLTQPGAIPSSILNAATQLGDYLNLLIMAPSVHWQQGTQLWQGIKDWPNLSSALKPPGTSLITFDYYSAVPGIILYDFVPTEKALELTAEGALYATAAAALYQIGLELAPAVSGGLAYMADIASSLAVATLTGFEGGVA